MTIYYSTTTGGFYDTAIHGDNIPDDAVEITADEHADLLAGQAAGQCITADDDGYPVLVDPDDLLTDEEKTELESASVRAERDRLIAEADILIYKAEDAGEDTTDLRAYRQALRDVRSRMGFRGM